jgi:hypothetical protein
MWESGTMFRTYEFIHRYQQKARVGFQIDAIAPTHRFQPFHGDVYRVPWVRVGSCDRIKITVSSSSSSSLSASLTLLIRQPETDNEEHQRAQSKKEEDSLTAAVETQRRKCGRGCCWRPSCTGRIAQILTSTAFANTWNSSNVIMPTVRSCVPTHSRHHRLCPRQIIGIPLSTVAASVCADDRHSLPSSRLFLRQVTQSWGAVSGCCSCGPDCIAS